MPETDHQQASHHPIVRSCRPESSSVCGPCRESIPHLTEVDRQYRSKGVTFIGVDVWEPEVENAKPLVDEMGATMGYNVAVDWVPPDLDPHDGAMAKSWLRAAQEYYIPTAFEVKGRKPGRDGY